jgi:hypothetical protein
MATPRAATEHHGFRFKEPVMLKLLSLLPWCKPHVTLRRGARKPDLLNPPLQDEDRPLGCGWFDSSHELERGLQVRETDATFDTGALSALPLGEWLALELRSWRGQPQAG